LKSAVCGRPEGRHDISLSIVRKRHIDQDVGRGRTNTGPDNRQEIVSKIRE
jgi:hypothetical protein